MWTTLVLDVFAAAGCILLADFLSGFFHWFEDGYFRETTPVIGRLVVGPNVVRHHSPRAFVTNSWLSSADIPPALGALTILPAYLLGFLTERPVRILGGAADATVQHSSRGSSRPTVPPFP